MQRYGMTLADYDALLRKQGGKCALCDFVPGDAPLHIDHQHVEGYAELPPKEKRKYVRGLLCAGCNRLVAAFDSMNFFERAMTYLKRD